MEIPDLRLGADRAVDVGNYNTLEATPSIRKKSKVSRRNKRVRVAARIEHLVKTGDTAG
jgi:hypothetical protein